MREPKAVDVALAEAEAQVSILRALKSLDPSSIERVLKAVGYILAAEKEVPGIMARIAK